MSCVVDGSRVASDDFLTQTQKDGGLALSTTSVSAAFLAIIVALVTYLTASQIDQEEVHLIAA